MSLRAGFVGLIGLPNAGKSTLVNTLVGEKIAIVTPKAQTTRQRIQGIVTEEDLQLILVDTPGLVRSEMGLNHFLQVEAEDVIEQSDVLIATLNIDSKNPEHLQQVLEKVAESKKPWLAVITKTDTDAIHRIPKIEEMVSSHGGKSLALSAVRNPEETRRELVSALRELTPESDDLLYDPELFTTQTIRQMACEIIREKCFEVLRQEIPYGLAIQITKFEEGKTPKIYAELWLSKEGHKNIVIGTGGKTLKAIGMKARKDIEKLMGGKVFLDLHVTIKKKWALNEKAMKELGYVVS